MFLPVQTWISPSHSQHKVRRVIKLEGVNLFKRNASKVEMKDEYYIRPLEMPK